MKVLLVGSGGREHALGWALKRSKDLTHLYAAPGNAGIAEIAECVDIAADDLDALVAFAQKKAIDFVIVGPEGPLVAGLGDAMRAAGFPVFGPSKAAAQLEGSKAFMKDLCKKYNIPTAAYGRFTDYQAAKAFIESHGAPIVLKTDGLAAGKGVIIAESVIEATETARAMLSGESFGEAGSEIVVEEFLDGEELSFFALADGKSVAAFGSAQDHKRVFDGDEGPNTGGMGAYSPAHLMTPELEQKIMERLILPTIAGMAAEGCPFAGVLFAGIMVVKGEPYLIEYNIRFGDPECQALMMRFDGDLLRVLRACAAGSLASVQDQIKWSADTALCVVMAANGYPGAYEKGSEILGLDDARRVPHAKVFHAGTRQNEAGRIIAASGRVLGVTATGPNVRAAQDSAYEAVDQIKWPGGFCRRDIGWRAIAAGKQVRS